MEKVTNYLDRPNGQELPVDIVPPETAETIHNFEELEALLKEVEEDIVVQQSLNLGLVSNAMLNSTASRRPSFVTLERLLNTVDSDHRLSALTDSPPPSPSPDMSIDQGEFPEPDAHVIKHIFFDCDGTLVDTEAINAEACSIVVNKFLADHNIPHTHTTEELLMFFFGCTVRKMINLIAEVYELTVSLEQISAYVAYEEDLVIELIHANPKPCDGIERLLDHLTQTGRYTFSVVSSSPMRRIRAALEATGITKFFNEDQVFSAESSLPTPKPKPHPAVYMFAMAYNKVHPWQCVTFEDSRSGARSAILAEIPCIAFLGTYNTPKQREQIEAILIQEGCTETIKSWSQAAGCLEKVERAAAIDVTTSLDNWDCLDERRRHLRMRSKQLLAKRG